MRIMLIPLQSFQVSQYPRRRLIRSLKYVEEELLAIYKIMREQHDQYVNLSKVLLSASSYSLIKSGSPRYDLELDLINKLCFKSTQRLGAMEQLLRRVTRLIEDTKTSVEINDDDHGKAILVFTIVTLVFLPLSFVASFLGMNTADIRNQTANQALYWIIALPVTAGVVIIALVIGYKYEAMKDHIERYMGKVKKE
jgi:Mg2+ and Co2+ transporter CorA